MYSMDPVADASAYFDKLHAENEAYERAEQQMREEFMAACLRRDVDAKFGREPFGDVMIESLDYNKGPKMIEAMQILLDAAFNYDKYGIGERARDLLRRMAVAHANFNTEV